MLFSALQTKTFFDLPAALGAAINKIVWVPKGRISLTAVLAVRAQNIFAGNGDRCLGLFKLKISRLSLSPIYLHTIAVQLLLGGAQSLSQSRNLFM